MSCNDGKKKIKILLVSILCFVILLLVQIFYRGAEQKPLLRIRSVAADSFPKSSKGRRILRGFFDGSHVRISPKQQNGQLAAGIGCNCLIDIPAGSGAVEAGDPGEIILVE